MLQDGGDASLKEGKVHQADAAQVRFLLILGNNLAKSSDDLLGSGSKSHDTLVLGRDGKVVQGKASKVATVSTFLGQALSKGRKDIILSTADHGDTVLLVTDIAQFVDALGGGGALLSLGVEHGLEKLRDIIKSRGLRRGTLEAGIANAGNNVSK
jgi:hypothetical protein